MLWLLESNHEKFLLKVYSLVFDCIYLETEIRKGLATFGEKFSNFSRKGFGPDFVSIHGVSLPINRILQEPKEALALK